MDASVRLALFELAGAVHMPRALPLFWKRLEVQGRLASLSSCFVPRFGRKRKKGAPDLWSARIGPGPILADFGQPWAEAWADLGQTLGRL